MKWFEHNVIAPIDRGIAKVEEFWDRGPTQKILVLFGFFLSAVILIEVVAAIFV